MPSNINLPFGLISFTANNVSVAGEAGFSVFVDASVSVNGYFKQNAAGKWVNIATNIQTVGSKTRIDFKVIDGGEFDLDGSANGSIRDPGGPGYLQSVASVCNSVNDPMLSFMPNVDASLLQGGVESLLQHIREVLTAITPTVALELLDTGKLEVTIDDTVYPLQLVKLERADVSEPTQISFTQDGLVKVVTADHRALYLAASVGDMSALQQGLAGFDLTVMSLIHGNGNLVVKAQGSEPCILARPSILAESAEAAVPSLELRPYLQGEVANVTIAYLTFIDSNGTLKQQAMLPTPADWTSLKQALEKLKFTHIVLQDDGIIRAEDAGGVEHKAIMGYGVTPSNLSSAAVSFDTTIGDVNEDGQVDINVTYPNGDQQPLILFIQP